MRVIDYTAENLLVPALKATDRAGAYQELAERLHLSGCIGEPDAFARELRAPDGGFHPGTDHSVVFAWARGRFVRKTGFALGKSRAGIAVGAPPDATAHLLFVIAAPTTKLCVDLLTVLAKLVYNPDCRARLLAAQTPREIFAALAAQPQPPPQVQLGLFHR
jgi:PTS system fructose-specific IIC component